MKERALRRKTMPAPRSAEMKAPTSKPPRAGPTARAMLKPALLMATASGSCSRGTSSGTMAAQAGLFMAEPMFMRKVRPSRVQGRTPVVRVSAARMPTAASIQDCQMISRRRRSKISAVAPAKNPRNRTGRLAAVCIKAMSSADLVRTVISQVPAVSCIQEPTLEMIDASQRLRKKGKRRGAQAERGAPSVVVAAGAPGWVIGDCAVAGEFDGTTERAVGEEGEVLRGVVKIDERK